MEAFLYQYGFGAVLFAAGLVVARRHGYVGLAGRGLKNLLLTLGALGIFFTFQAYLQFAPMTEAPARVFEGESQRPAMLGAPLDYGIMVAYFLIILAIGTWFGRRQKSLKDFFFAGQRFSWWWITFSLVATVVGSYSFVKYSQVGYRYGLGSTQSYTNDWIWLPLLVFGWLPLLYFSRVTSIPEYFERRFDRRVRMSVTALLLVYLVGYVGVNLFTMGKVLNILLGWPVWPAAILVAAVSAVYVTAGGQTSVIMTDLFQGVMLLVTGLLLLGLGIAYLGGFGEFWQHLPRGHRLAFPNFNEDPSFPAIGIFWQDAFANTAMFYFLNQGVIMRFLSARSPREGRKAMFAVVLILMPVAAVVVAGGGWVARALVQAGALPATLDSGEAFFVAAALLSRPGVFGLILAAMTAALMSTVDTLITAVAAIAVNDVYRPLIRPEASEKELLRVARGTALGVTLLGILLVPVFMSFKTIYEAHGAFTAAVTPPLVVTLLLSVFWRRFTRQAALWTLVGGMAAVVVSLFIPEVIRPFAHGVPMGEAGSGLLAGASQYKFMRAFFGVVVCTTIGVVTTLFTRPESEERQRGLVWGTLEAALEKFKGAPGRESEGETIVAHPSKGTTEPPPRGASGSPVVRLSGAAARALGARPGDLLYLSDQRSWLGGLRSTHAVAGELLPEEQSLLVELGPETFEALVARGRDRFPIRIERLF